MPAKPPRISDAELELLQLLWAESPLGATELADRLPEGRDWTLATVKTLLSRLLAKGAVAADQDGRRYRYRPLIDRDSMSARQARGLVDRLFGGRVSPLVAQLAEQQELTDQDLAELEALVRSLRK
jgi:predicted transcriptional regulator